MAPSRRAVAIACRPATPAPMTNTRAGGTVPAAVIIIGKPRWNAPARLDHRAVAGEVGLAGQHVHRLGAGDARQQLHRRGIDAGLRPAPAPGRDRRRRRRCRPAARRAGSARAVRAAASARRRRCRRRPGRRRHRGRSRRRRRRTRRRGWRPCAGAGFDRDGEARPIRRFTVSGVAATRVSERAPFLQHRKAHAPGSRVELRRTMRDGPRARKWGKGALWQRVISRNGRWTGRADGARRPAADQGDGPHRLSRPAWKAAANGWPRSAPRRPRRPVRVPRWCGDRRARSCASPSQSRVRRSCQARTCPLCRFGDNGIGIVRQGLSGGAKRPVRGVADGDQHVAHEAVAADALDRRSGEQGAEAGIVQGREFRQAGRGQVGAGSQLGVRAWRGRSGSRGRRPGNRRSRRCGCRSAARSSCGIGPWCSMVR